MTKIISVVLKRGISQNDLKWPRMSQNDPE